MKTLVHDSIREGGQEWGRVTRSLPEDVLSLAPPAARPFYEETTAVLAAGARRVLTERLHAEAAASPWQMPRRMTARIALSASFADAHYVSLVTDIRLRQAARDIYEDKRAEIWDRQAGTLLSPRQIRRRFGAPRGLPRHRRLSAYLTGTGVVWFSPATPHTPYREWPLPRS